MKVTEGIQWIVACTARFDETVAFFRDVMGLTVRETGVPTVDTQFKRYAQFRMPNDVVLEIVEPIEFVREIYDGPILSITVEDVVQSRRELEGMHIEFVAPVFETHEGWGWTYFRAPDGHIYQIQGPCRK